MLALKTKEIHKLFLNIIEPFVVWQAHDIGNVLSIFNLSINEII